ncbi:MAG: helix-turn-helix transcriptional regulator [Erysipelotrichaceae bacterium]|nr:helix-turn-helix transcriptional regulator [Erysipelotrichaceae bacterium]
MNIKTANRLCELRKAHNLSQEELAYKLGVSRQAVSKWERSESSPDTDNLIQLAALYNISLDELLNGSEAISLIEENKVVKEEDLKKEIILNSSTKVILGGDEASVIYDENNKIDLTIKDVLKWNEKIKVIDNMVMSISAILFTAIYLVLGFTLNNGWSHFWFLFILIPVPSSIVNMIARKNINLFQYEVLAASIYCALGMFFNLWHPLWVIFLSVPLFRLIAGLIMKHKTNPKQDVIDAYYQDIEEDD